MRIFAVSICAQALIDRYEELRNHDYIEVSICAQALIDRRFEFDDGRASIDFLRDGKYWTNLKSAYVDAEGFKEIIHIANVFGGVYGASKRDYELFLKYFEASKEKNKSDYYDDRIRLVKNTISIIENNSFYIPEWVSRPKY